MGGIPSPSSARCCHRPIPSPGCQFLFPCRHLVAKACITVPLFSREKATGGPFHRPRSALAAHRDDGTAHVCECRGTLCFTLRCYKVFFRQNRCKIISGRRPEALCNNCIILIFKRSMLLSMRNT